MFGYLSASLASFFVGQDAGNPSAEVAGAEAIANLQNEITALREELQAVLRRKVE
jgi:voltage-gated potassium channel